MGKAMIITHSETVGKHFARINKIGMGQYTLVTDPDKMRGLFPKMIILLKGWQTMPEDDVLAIRNNMNIMHYRGTRLMYALPDDILTDEEKQLLMDTLL